MNQMERINRSSYVVLVGFFALENALVGYQDASGYVFGLGAFSTLQVFKRDVLSGHCQMLTSELELLSRRFGCQGLDSAYWYHRLGLPERKQGLGGRKVTTHWLELLTWRVSDFKFK